MANYYFIIKPKDEYLVEEVDINLSDYNGRREPFDIGQELLMYKYGSEKGKTYGPMFGIKDYALQYKKRLRVLISF